MPCDCFNGLYDGFGCQNAWYVRAAMRPYRYVMDASPDIDHIDAMPKWYVAATYSGIYVGAALPPLTTSDRRREKVRKVTMFCGGGRSTMWYR